MNSPNTAEATGPIDLIFDDRLMDFEDSVRSFCDPGCCSYGGHLSISDAQFVQKAYHYTAAAGITCRQPCIRFIVDVVAFLSFLTASHLGRVY